RKQGGTGLGLTLAKKIIEAHGSHLVVSSIPGKGSKFDFMLQTRPN
ncbi:sensor histidine kinase, partial [bacterium]|nr:sensor histidine kinase [bacterium]